MGCFTLQWLMQLLILLVVVGAIIAILKILVPYVLSKVELGEAGGVIIRVLTIVFWAVVVIFVIYIVFALIGCLWSMGGGFRGLFPR